MPLEKKIDNKKTIQKSKWGKSINMLENRIINDMEINNELKHFLQSFIRDEINNFFLLNKEKILQMILCKPDNAIKNDKKAYDNLIKLCDKTPKNFTTKKEYMLWLEQGV